MKPTVAELHSLCPSIPKGFVENHLSRLGDDYFSTFTKDEVLRHIEVLTQITPQNPVQVLIERVEDTVVCTVLAFNYRTQFSLITGILTSVGLIILSGDAFTYSPPPPFQPQQMRRGTRKTFDPLRRRFIVDRFSAVFNSDVDVSDWEHMIAERLTGTMLLLESGKDNDVLKARSDVNQLVAVVLGDLQVESALPVLYPIDIRITGDAGPYTTISVASQDTPAFLYSLSNALSLWGISIEHVQIETRGGMVQDVIGILDSRGEKITDREQLDRIRLSVLLTKQFTHFLPAAPDPYAALSRFEHLSREVVDLPERRQWLEQLSHPDILQDLARILGASDFIWEDFLRSQYEALLPILSPKDTNERVSFSRDDMEARLNETIAEAETYDQKREQFNAWKDHEIFLIDLDHMLHSKADVRSLAEPLTNLAEIVIARAADTVYWRLADRFGMPRTVGKLKAEFAVFGLGKLGGVALGYASDIELLFVYSDNGKTDGVRSINNSEFFNLLVDDTTRFIKAKREGIFRVDLRLRPYGDSGPKSASLEGFCHYYGSPGEAHSYERLALTRLRAIAGNEELGRQVERLRNEFVYSSRSVDMDELRELRERQFETKVKGSRYNAKFSPGALVDVEYFVQILQVFHGTTAQQLRTPRIHRALTALSEIGILEASESNQLIEAYYFLRRLINGLRMLRGNALDLFLPPPESQEYAHLARRMGYRRNRELDPEQQLFVDFETHTGIVRASIEKYFGRDHVPHPEQGNVVDLVLSPVASPNLQHAVLSKAGFVNTQRAYVNLRKLAGSTDQRDSFAKLAVLAFDILSRVPDSDMALNNWERFVDVMSDTTTHYGILLSQPRRLDILLRIFSGSQFLADTLVRNPEFLDWVTDSKILRGIRGDERLAKDLDDFLGESAPHLLWQNRIRIFRRREMLRIGTRDICLRRTPIEGIMSDLSTLADTITQAALERDWQENAIPKDLGNPHQQFCVIALGKLGGSELNYSSDIDLLGLYDDSISYPGARSFFADVMARLRANLSDHTEEGYAYRVDLRLRPYGRFGELVQPLSSMVHYYRNKASLWETQALLKARPIAGAFELGERFIEEVKPTVVRKRKRETIASSIRKMRSKTLQSKAADTGLDIKNGIGGIRDVEFLIQGLQLMHLPDHPELFAGNTLHAMELLEKIHALPSAVISSLREDYLFLRRVEHYLQLLEDRQTHTIPQDSEQLAALSRRALGEKTSSTAFTTKLQAASERIHGNFNDYLL